MNSSELKKDMQALMEEAEKKIRDLGIRLRYTYTLEDGVHLVWKKDTETKVWGLFITSEDKEGLQPWVSARNERRCAAIEELPTFIEELKAAEEVEVEDVTDAIERLKAFLEEK